MKFIGRKKRKLFKQKLMGSDNKKGGVPQKLNPRYLEQEREIYDLSKNELEKKINKMLSETTQYGDIAMWIDGKIHILRRETFEKENHYFVKIIKDRCDVSTERVVKSLKDYGGINPESCLVDVIFYQEYRILLFRK